MPDDMTLRMRIRARGQQALAVLRSVNDRVRRITTSIGRMGRTGAATFRGLGRAGGLMLRPIKLLSGLALGLGLTFGALSGKALGAQGDLEALQIRLESVSKSAADARRIFAETRDLSIASPFTPDQLVDARIALLNLGQTGKDAITSLGDAAAITQRPLGDLASVVASLETEPLRRIGIQLKREAGTFSFEFRDRMQEVRTIVADGVDDARRALLSIFDIKYGGGMGRFAAAWRGLMSTIRGNIKLALGQFGEGLMPAAKGFAAALNSRITDLMERGTLKDWGERVGTALTRAFDYGASVVERAKEIVTAVRDDPEKMLQGVSIVMRTGADILATSLVNYLRAMGGVFAGIGRMIAGAFMEDLLLLPLPGMANVRQRKAAEAFDAMSLSQFRKLKTEGIDQVDIWNAVFAGSDNRLQARIAAMQGPAAFQRGLDQAIGAFPGAAKETAGATAQLLAAAGAQLRALAPPGKTVNELYAERQAAREAATAPFVGPPAPNMDLVTTLENRTRAGAAWARQRRFQAPLGEYSVGQEAPGGGTVIRIEQLVVEANNVAEMVEGVKTAGANPALAPAAT